LFVCELIEWMVFFFVWELFWCFLGSSFLVCCGFLLCFCEHWWIFLFFFVLLCDWVSIVFGFFFCCCFGVQVIF